MKKFITILCLGLCTVNILTAQKASVYLPKPAKTFPVLKNVDYYEMVSKFNNSLPSRASRSACDRFELDLGLYDYLFKTKQTTLNYTGSWFEANPIIMANGITPFVDTLNINNLTYVKVVYDSIVKLSDIISTPLFSYIPISLATVYIDSVILGYALDVDSNKLTNTDSLNITVQKKQGSTFLNVKKVAVVGSSLKPYITGGFVNRAKSTFIGCQLNKGDIFSIQVEWKTLDTAKRFYLTYSYGDSCGTITFNGQQFSSPAYPSVFKGKNYFGEILADSLGLSVLDTTNAATYIIPSTPINCSYVYYQNHDIVPLITICTDPLLKIAYSKTSACKGHAISLSAFVFGFDSTQLQNLQYTWTTSSGSLTINSGSNTSLIMGSTDATIYLTATDGATSYIDSLHLFLDTLNCQTYCAAFFTIYPDSSAAQTWTVYNYSASQYPLNYVWFWGDGTTSNGITPSHTYSSPGFYNICLQVSDTLGCTNTYCDSSTYIFKTDGIISIKVVNRTTITNTISDVNTESKIAIFPNPSSGLFQLESPKSANLHVFNILGAKVLSKTLIEGYNTFDLSGYTNGIYIVKLEVEGKTYTQKVVKQ